MTPGNTNSIAMVVMLCTDVGDAVLCDEFTYTGLMAATSPLGRKAIGVSMDEDGMSPSALRTLASGLAEQGRAPRLVYLVPSGQNPTAITMSEGRRRELYEVARQLGLFILEDDPYCHLALGPPSAASESDMPGLEKGSVPPSFLALDTDGRVCRLDTTSKIFAPGFRMGWLTAPRTLTEKLSVMSEVLTWTLSGFTQQALLHCVEEFGEDGLHRHVQQVQWAYRQRRDRCIAAFERHLQGVAFWRVPSDGMFLWLEVLGVHDAGRLAEPLIDRGVALVPGGAFMAAPNSKACSHFRVSFAQLSEEVAEVAARRLSEALRDDVWLEGNGCGRTISSRNMNDEPAAKARKIS